MRYALKKVETAKDEFTIVGILAFNFAAPFGGLIVRVELVRSRVKVSHHCHVSYLVSACDCHLLRRARKVSS